MKKINFLFVIVALSCFSSFIFAKRGERCVVIVSTGFNDDGKSKITLKLAKKADAIVRSQIASWNAHTGQKGNEIFQCYLLPPAIIRKNVECFFTQGMDLDCKQLLDEIELFEKKGFELKGRLWISSRSHIVMPYHRYLAELDNQKGRRKTHDFSPERRGISWCAADKRLRGGIRVVDIINEKTRNQRIKEMVEYANIVIKEVYGGAPMDVKEIQKEYTDYAHRIKPYVSDLVEINLNKMLAAGKSVIVEATGGMFLDVGLGTVPFVSPSSTTVQGALVGSGIAIKRVGEVIGVVKAYGTRSGKGPFPTEIKDPVILDNFKKTIQKNFKDRSEVSVIKYDTRTIPFLSASNELEKNCETLCECDRDMRFGWLDLILVREAILINGIDTLALTMLDNLDDFEEIFVCYDYVLDGVNLDHLPPLAEDAARVKPRYMKFKGWKTSTQNIKKFSDLPEEARYFVKKIEMLCNNTPINYISVGPDNSQIIVVQESLIL